MSIVLIKNLTMSSRTGSVIKTFSSNKVLLPFPAKLQKRNNNYLLSILRKKFQYRDSNPTKDNIWFTCLVVIKTNIGVTCIYMRNINLNSAQTQLLASLLPEYLKVRVVLFTPLMGWSFEDHFEDSKGPGPQGHDAIAGFFGLKTQPLHNILGRNATSSLYIHIHTQIQRWWRATSSVLKERGHACAVATHISVRVGPHRCKI